MLLKPLPVGRFSILALGNFHSPALLQFLNTFLLSHV